MEKFIFDGSQRGAKLERNPDTAITKVLKVPFDEPNLPWVNQPTPWGMHYHIEKDGKVNAVLPTEFRGSIGNHISGHDTVLITFESGIKESILKEKVDGITSKIYPDNKDTSQTQAKEKGK